MATPVPAAADAGAAEPAYSDLPARSRQAPARPPVPPSSPRAHTLRRIAVALAAILGLWAAIAAATGGVTLDAGRAAILVPRGLAAGGDRPADSSRSPCGVPPPTSAGGCWTTTAAAVDRHAPAGRRPARRRAADGVGGARRARRRRRRQQRLPESVAIVGAGTPDRRGPGARRRALARARPVRRAARLPGLGTSRRARPHLRSGAAVADGDRRRRRSATPAATSGRRLRPGCSCGPPTGSPRRRHRRRWRWPRRWSSPAARRCSSSRCRR